MPTSAQVTEVRTTASSASTSVHHIAWSGLAGAAFWVVIGAALTGIIGFSTNSWAHLSGRTQQIGLWEECICTKPTFSSQAWFQATQAFMVLTLLSLIGCVVAAILYMFVHQVSKVWVLRVLVATAAAAALFCVVALLVFGSNVKQNLHFSFGLSCISAILSVAALVIAVFMMRKSGTC